MGSTAFVLARLSNEGIFKEMTVQCPTCFEFFEVSEVAPEDYGTQMDYDCEVCCRPLVLSVDEDGELSALSLDE